MKIKTIAIALSLLLCTATASAQEAQKSSLQQRAEAAAEKGKVGEARFNYIRAYEDYANRGQIAQGVHCGVKATAMYYKENYYKEAFDLLHHIDQNIIASNQSASEKAALHYLTAKERMQMYMKLRKPASAADQLGVMEVKATAAANDDVRNDLLYNKAIYYYTFGQNAKGNAVFNEMASKLTASKEYGKVDEVYKTLIANGRKSGNAGMVAQAYSSYMDWKDSVSAMKLADETGALKQQIADNEASIAEKDGSLATRQAFIVALAILAAALAAALVTGALVLMRYILQNRKLKKTLSLSNESNALKAQFISNISAQLEPTLKRLDSQKPEVKAMLDFSRHIQTLSTLENSDTLPEAEDIKVQAFLEGLMQQIEGAAKPGVALKVEAPKMSVVMNREYVSHILSHLLRNAAEYTPEGGKITLEFRKRGARSFQFLVTDSGQGIAPEQRDDIFKPFREVRDLTTGDGLGLPVCKQMALKMDGDLTIDPEYSKGTRFILQLHS